MSAAERARYEVVVRGLADADAAAILAAELRKLCSEPPPTESPPADVPPPGGV